MRTVRGQGRGEDRWGGGTDVCRSVVDRALMVAPSPHPPEVDSTMQVWAGYGHPPQDAHPTAGRMVISCVYLHRWMPVGFDGGVACHQATS